MKRSVPSPGDLIIVERSEWYALKDGERLRVCEHAGWINPAEELFVAPRNQVNTFWGPQSGPPDGKKPETMSTSGGPFKTVRLEELHGLERIGAETDQFWCWKDRPRANGGLDRTVEVSVWRLPVLPDGHYQNLVAHGCPTHRDRLAENEPLEAEHPADTVAESPATAAGGKALIRLACLHCDRKDFDGVDSLPCDWTDIHEVQTLLESIEALEEEEGEEVSLVSWETHLGVCPECNQAYERSDAPKARASESAADNDGDDDVRPIHPIVRQIIDRDCHVGEDHRQVVRHVISKLRNGYATFRAMSPADRRELIDQCVRRQRENRREYVEVMSGFTYTLGRSNDQPLPSSLLGREVASLMRRHHMTIEALAFRLGTSMKRVRQIRTQGLHDPLAVRDWIEAITGEDPGSIPEAYRIRNQSELADCRYCGFPLDVGDTAYEYVGDVFCSTSCCRKSRGW